MNIYSIPLLCFAFGVLLNGILVLFKRKDYVSYRFFSFSIAVFGWGFLTAVWMDQNLSVPHVLPLIKISFAFASFIPVTWAHFIFAMINKREPFKFFYFSGYLIATIFASFAPTSLFVSGVHQILSFKNYTTPGILYHFYTLTYFIIVPYTFFFLFKTYRGSSGDVKKQLFFLLTGTLIGFGAAGTAFLPAYNISCPITSFVLLPLYPLLTGIAMIRYGLFDVQEIADAFQREKMAVLGTMAASLNHEIKNPLYVVRGKAECYLDALERGKYSSYEDIRDASVSAVNPILNQVTRALDIIQKFTDFARPFNSKGSKETVILSEVFNDVRELVSSEFQRSEVKLVHNLTNGVAVVANRRHVEEILSNLVINACHAMQRQTQDPGSKIQDARCKTQDSGLMEQDASARNQDSSNQNLDLGSWLLEPGSVTVNAHQTNGKVIVEVSDTGPGISKENLARVFEPFFTTKGPKGSGLGLYITKQLVERNGGKISVKSKLGEGTSFKLEFKI